MSEESQLGSRRSRLGDHVSASQESRAASLEPGATSGEPPAPSHEPRATSDEPPATSREPQATSHERRATSDEPRLLSVDHLTVGFDINRRFLPAVIDVSFEVARGETLCLVGESGSGKSVTAMAIMRLVERPGRIAGGSIRFNGIDLLRLPEREMEARRGASIGLIFQEPMTALNPVFTIGSQIEETLRVHGRATRRTAPRKAIELLDAVSVPEPQRRVREYPHQLSGGLRQRALIALALSCGPELVVADEPTTALDVTIQAQILELLRDLQKRMGLALLLITHDLGVVAEMADRVAVMYAGRIVEQAPVGALFKDPKHPYTRGLMGSIPDGAHGSRLVAIPGTVPPLGQLPPGCCFEPRCPDRFEPCPTRHPGDTVFGAEAALGAGDSGLDGRTARSEHSASRLPIPASRRVHTVKCYLHGPAVEVTAGSDPGTDPKGRP